MNFKLDEEINIIQKLLFNIEKEQETFYKNLFLHRDEDISFIEKKGERTFYEYYPYLFYDEFRIVNQEKYRKLALSGSLLLKNILLNDKLMDFKDLIDPSRLFSSNFLYKKSLDLLYSIFTASSVFWNYFEKYNKEFTNAVFLERSKHFGIVSPYPYTDFEIIARGKAAISKNATTALAILSNTPEKIEPLETTQNYFNTAFQLYDDLLDWKEDYLNRNYSYLLTTVIYENQLVEEVKSNNTPDLETISRAIYLSKAAENQMDNALLALTEAAIYGKNCSLWLENIKKIALKCQQAKDSFVATRSKLLSRKRIQRVQNTKIPKKSINTPRFRIRKPSHNIFTYV